MEKRLKTMKRTCRLCFAVSVLLLLFLTAMAGIRRHDAALASRIAPEILRFHVLADSDSPEDQAVKLEIKDLLLEAIQEGLVACQSSDDSLSKEAVQNWILEHKAALETAADEYLKARGLDYGADIRLETCEFPQKTYGDMTFPAGTYDAVRVLLGSGSGQNFWCVLYPSLCYLDSTHAVVPEESQALLKTLIPEDDFFAMLSARGVQKGSVNEEGSSKETPSSPQDSKRAGDSRLKIRFRLYEMLKFPFTAQS